MDKASANNKCERDRRSRLAQELLAEVADVEDDSQGEFDSAETVRQMRDERIAQILGT